ncbi:MAG: YbaN family protein [Sphingomonadales bacterium]|jgi:uncharacterized membrane protein YbaN (DUF454 family)
MRRQLWIAAGCTCVALGAAGVVLPLLPTTPFVLLAAWCFARSSPRLHDWLLAHRLFGPLISNWRQHRAISRTAKRASLASMAAVLGISWVAGVDWHVLAIQAGVLSITAGFILTRPDGPKRP